MYIVRVLNMCYVCLPALCSVATSLRDDMEGSAMLMCTQWDRPCRHCKTRKFSNHI